MPVAEPQEHKISTTPVDDSLEVKMDCTCGWTFTASESKFTSVIGDRHLRVHGEK